MLELRIKTASRRYVAPADLPHVLGHQRALAELGDMVEALIAQMDMLDGDPDLEETDAEDSFAFSARALGWALMEGAGCAIGDGDTVAYPEWQTLQGKAKGAQMPISHNEDDEEDDPHGVCDEDGVNTCLGMLRAGPGAGCDISEPDHGIDDVNHDGDEGLAVLSWGMNQEEPLRVNLDVDAGFMARYRDRIRKRHYIKISTWRGTVWKRSDERLQAANAD